MHCSPRFLQLKTYFNTGQLIFFQIWYAFVTWNIFSSSKVTVIYSFTYSSRFRKRIKISFHHQNNWEADLNTTHIFFMFYFPRGRRRIKRTIPRIHIVGRVETYFCRSISWKALLYCFKGRVKYELVNCNCSTSRNNVSKKSLMHFYTIKLVLLKEEDI